MHVQVLTILSLRREIVLRRTKTPRLRTMIQQRSTPMTAPPLGKNGLPVVALRIHGKSLNILFTLCNSLSPSRALKRTKAYQDLNDVRPTLRNKPSGLKQDWHRTASASSARSMSSTPSTSSKSSTLSKSSAFSRSSTLSRSSTSRQQGFPTQTQSGPSSVAATLASPTFSDSPLPDLDHTSSLLAMSPPPVVGRSSMPLFREGLVSPVDEDHILTDAVCAFVPQLNIWSWTHSSQPLVLAHSYKDDQGRTRQPGLKDLPHWLRETFRDRFIRHLVEQVFLSDKPWSNPPLSSLQREFNHAYPTHQVRLHSDDAAVVPVSLIPHTTHWGLTHCADTLGSRSPSEPDWE